MKYVAGLLLLFYAFNGSSLSAAPLFIDNHGYVLGELNSVDFVGLNRKVISGQVSIGNNSFTSRSDYQNSAQGDYFLNNPWQFCGDQGAYDKIASHMGEFVIIEYKTPKTSALLACSSANEILGIYPVSRDKPVITALESRKINLAGKPYGVSVGRIVNAQKSSRHGDNWSVVIQVGNSGSEFRYLQIVDADIYGLALDSLISASRVNLYHVDQMHGGGRPGQIDSYVWKIEIKPGL